MPSLYLPIKEAILSVIRKHFPGPIASRFSVRLEDEIFIAGEDKNVWQRKKAGKQRIHILFDMIDIFEIPPELPKYELERYILFAFKWSIEDGIISITKKPEFTDPSTAKKRKTERQVQAKAKRRMFIEKSMAGVKI